MKKTLGLTIAFLGAGLMSATLLHSTGAEAVTRKVSAGACYAGASYNFLYADGVHNSIAGRLVCPVPDDDLLFKEDVDEIVVHGYDANNRGYMRAQACVAYNDYRGSVCGPSSYSGYSFVGDYSLTPSLRYFDAAHAPDYGYVLVTMPSPPDGSDYRTWSSVRGYTITD